MTFFDQLIHILGSVLNRNPQALDSNTALLGAIAEFDSMALMTLLIEIEQQLGIQVSDMDLQADVFATVNSLYTYLMSVRADAA